MSLLQNTIGRSRRTNGRILRQFWENSRMPHQLYALQKVLLYRRHNNTRSSITNLFNNLINCYNEPLLLNRLSDTNNNTAIIQPILKFDRIIRRDRPLYHQRWIRFVTLFRVPTTVKWQKSHYHLTSHILINFHRIYVCVDHWWPSTDIRFGHCGWTETPNRIFIHFDDGFTSNSISYQNNLIYLTHRYLCKIQRQLKHISSFTFHCNLQVICRF